MSLQRVFTISHPKDFDFLFKKGKRLEGIFFRLFYADNGLTYNRFAFVVSKATEKKAVVRNRLRRMVKEWIRKNYPIDKEIKIDMIFLFKKGVSKISKKEFYEELSKKIGQISV